MEDNKNLENQETEIKGTEVKEEVKIEQEKEPVQKAKLETKEVPTEEKKEKKEEVKSDDKYAELLKQVKEVTDQNNKIKEEMKAEKIKNFLMEKIENKELQKAVMETGLVQDVDDIEKVLKIVEASKVLNKSRFTDGYKPHNEVQTDVYKQAQAKGNVFEMIRQKLSI